MNRVLLGVTLVCGCWTSSAPVATEPTPRTRPKARSTVAPAAAPIRLELVEGTPSDLPDGTTVDVKHVGYMHLADSKNVSHATLVVARHGTSLDVGLANAHGSDVNKGVTKDALGWQFTLEMADPYQQPSRAIVHAKKL